MAGTINAGEDNNVAYYATLPSDNVNDRVIIDFEGRYVPDSYTDNIDAPQVGKWIKGVIPADGVPPRDDNYNIKIYSTTSGNITWAHEDRTWASITDHTWAEVEGIIRGVLINQSTMLVQGNEDYSVKQYVSSNDDVNNREYISNSESVSGTEYISDSDQRNTKSYY